MNNYLPWRRTLDVPTNAPWVSRLGKRLAEDTVNRVVRAMGERVGIEDVISHVLRYTYATELLRAGVDIVTVADLMGHASIETTRAYTRASEADLASAVEKLYTERPTDET